MTPEEVTEWLLVTVTAVAVLFAAGLSYFILYVLWKVIVGDAWGQTR